METLTHRGAEAIARAVPVGSLTHSLTNWPERELAATLHPQLFTMFAGVYGAMLLALWLLFCTDINAAIALGVSTGYFAMYFGLPFVMLRLANKDRQQPGPGSLGNFLAGDVETYTGPVSGWGAVAQLLTIPVALTAAFIAIGIISRLAT
ncbi:MAG: hypothetical protein J0I99_06960 [Devosia sp.]|uniref:hypothetical protein n=1 Tax=Devosia sp. TaxID=1871048 RepID=UPI001AD33252|nr:hypothetical protein [Devosia sp.]MBN9315456.1 hypothetical protein [Devosia sp.]